jgi:hypothetical protein
VEGRVPGPPESKVRVSCLCFMEEQRLAAYWVISSMAQCGLGATIKAMSDPLRRWKFGYRSINRGAAAVVSVVLTHEQVDFRQCVQDCWQPDRSRSK